MLGSQNPTLLQAVAIIMYFGLNFIQRLAAGCPPSRIATTLPSLTAHMCTSPFPDPEITYCESGVKEASNIISFVFSLPLKFCSSLPRLYTQYYYLVTSLHYTI